MPSAMRGVFAILPTPFKLDGEVDRDALRNIARFCLKSRVHGVVTPVNASEFTSLTDDERRMVVETVIDEVAGRIPVVVGVAGTCTEHALIFARHAREAGASSVIAMPPYVRRASEQEIRSYYQSIAAEARLPVWIQNHLPPIGTPMSPEFIASLVRDIEWVDYVKEECWPPGHYISATSQLCGRKLKGVMGGMAGRYLLDEARRGSCGTMPACEIADLHVALWSKIETGDEHEARKLFNVMLPLLNLEFMYGVSVYKEVLKRRGVIKNTVVRGAGHPTLDLHDQAELTAILQNLQHLFRVEAKN